MEQKNSKKTMSFTRMDRMVLESYKTLCEGLANYLGDGYEIVLHSLENYDNSVIKIINGYYTGRKEGAPITDLALHMLEDIRHNNGKDYIAYYSKNKKGEPMHSTTIAIRSENAKIVGLLCINFYLNTPLASVINTLMKTDDGTSVGREENFADSPSQLVGDTDRGDKARRNGRRRYRRARQEQGDHRAALQQGVFQTEKQRCRMCRGAGHQQEYRLSPYPQLQKFLKGCMIYKDIKRPPRTERRSLLSWEHSICRAVPCGGWSALTVNENNQVLYREL